MDDLFLSKIDMESSEDGCWLWTGCLSKAGYGQFRRKQTTYYAHRQSWLLAGNTIPDGHLIRHKCRSRNCCNPEHLETGTPQDNSNDMKRDGTTSRPNIIRQGQAHSMAKLTEKDVLDIRASKEGTMNLAKKYCVGYTHIWSIRTRKSWTHI